MNVVLHKIACVTIIQIANIFQFVIKNIQMSIVEYEI